MFAIYINLSIFILDCSIRNFIQVNSFLSFYFYFLTLEGIQDLSFWWSSTQYHAPVSSVDFWKFAKRRRKSANKWQLNMFVEPPSQNTGVLALLDPPQVLGNLKEISINWTGPLYMNAFLARHFRCIAT